MRLADRSRGQALAQSLRKYAVTRRALPGVPNPAAVTCLVEQLVESLRRIEFVASVSRRRISPDRLDPSSHSFDPVRAAILLKLQGQFDEACWMVFLFAHFGKRPDTEYRLTRDVYGALGVSSPWTWARVSKAPEMFRVWLAKNRQTLQTKPNRGYFGNHRKYLSLSPDSNGGTGEAFVSYVRWVKTYGGHNELLKAACKEAGEDRFEVFDWLYESMSVASFGRTGKFDYLTMLGKIGLADIEPGHPYLDGATGPLRGARLLFEGDPSAPLRWQDAQSLVTDLGRSLGVGMQVMEDAICNWQKSPEKFIAFRG